MRRFTFERSRRGSLHRYVHAPGGAVVVERPNFPVLTSAWGQGETPYTRFAVNNNNTEEVAVYLGLIWRLTEGRARFATPAYYRDQAARALGRAPILVEWEFEVDAEEGDPDAREKGFVPGRACISVPATDFQRAHRHQAGLFRVEAFSDLVALLGATLGDASAEVTVFAVREPRRDELVAALNSPAPPVLSDLLEEGELVVDLTIGVDLEYYDSLLIYSPEPIDDELDALTSQYERAIESYETRVPRVHTVRAMVAALELLAAAREQE